MARYTDHEFRAMEADPKWDKREPAVPTQSFDAWLAAEECRRIDDMVAELVEAGWSEDEAFIAVMQTIEDGG